MVSTLNPFLENCWEFDLTIPRPSSFTLLPRPSGQAKDPLKLPPAVHVLPPSVSRPPLLDPSNLPDCVLSPTAVDSRSRPEDGAREGPDATLLLTFP